MSEPELVRLRAREPAALESFFAAYFDRTHSLLFRLTGDRATAQDLTQETFLKIHRALDRLDPARDPWPWIVTTAVNTCRDHWGSAATRLGTLSSSLDADGSLLGALADRRPDPEGATLSREEAALVQQALQQIPEDARLVVLLHDWQGLGHDEIARITGRSHAAVRQKYRRALGLLGDLLKAVKP